MTALLFKERLDDLIECSFNSETGAPIPYMIMALEVAKAKCVTVQLQIEAMQKNKELAAKILPANGKLPPFEPR